MKTMRRLLPGATFLVACGMLAPRPALAVVEEDQTVVCTTTTIRTSIKETNNVTGEVTIREVISVEISCVTTAN